MIDQRTLQLIQKMIQKPLMEQEEIMRFFSLSKINWIMQSEKSMNY